jgi:hypothetical protein
MPDPLPLSSAEQLKLEIMWMFTEYGIDGYEVEIKYAANHQPLADVTIKTQNAPLWKIAHEVQQSLRSNYELVKVEQLTVGYMVRVIKHEEETETANS